MSKRPRTSAIAGHPEEIYSGDRTLIDTVLIWICWLMLALCMAGACVISAVLLRSDNIVLRIFFSTGSALVAADLLSVVKYVPWKIGRDEATTRKS